VLRRYVTAGVASNAGAANSSKSRWHALNHSSVVDYTLLLLCFLYPKIYNITIFLCVPLLYDDTYISVAVKQLSDGYRSQKDLFPGPFYWLCDKNLYCYNLMQARFASFNPLSLLFLISNTMSQLFFNGVVWAWQEAFIS
jgi:hypothetical protein